MALRPASTSAITSACSPRNSGCPKVRRRISRASDSGSISDSATADGMGALWGRLAVIAMRPCAFPPLYGEGVWSEATDGWGGRVQVLTRHSGPHFPTRLADARHPPHKGEGKGQASIRLMVGFWL